jgi:hypothetical protein
MLDTCIILNGPPNCGKDTLADLLVDYGFHKHEMKDRLYLDTALLFKVDLYPLRNRATSRHFKDEPWEDLVLDGKLITPRQALIHTSEDVIKPNQGDDYFGEAAARKCINQHSVLAVFSDGGFEAEIEPLLDIYENVVIFRLHRSDCSFEGDSRNYLMGFDSTYDVYLEIGKPLKALKDILSIVNTTYVGSAA